jgi:N4 Gp49/Sf6 Gp66 family protein
MSLESTEAECAANAVAPRVSLADIEVAILQRWDTTGSKAVFAADAAYIGPENHESLRLLSVCILVLRNGWTVIGKSAPASADNFNAALGRKLAYEDCIRQIWPLMGFALKERLHKEST